MKGLVISGTHSGVGKTVATLAVIRALTTAGYSVQPAKVGPDFIDPSHHERITGKTSRTLDSWMQGTDGIRKNYYRGSGDVCVIEGVMGLYDGDVSSTATVAETLDVPVVLVIDASAGMESVAATALGFRQYAERIDCDIAVVGIIAQRAHGGRHERGIRNALPREMTYFGRIPPREDLEIPDRHLGLHMGTESPIDTDKLDAVADHLDVQQLIAMARAPVRPDSDQSDSSIRNDTGDGPTIAIARDEAFCFVYPATIERFQDAGPVVTFEPVNEDDVPECDGIYLPGGYPELHAETLAESPTVTQIGELAADGLAILGECGGFMALSESLTTSDGSEHSMAGILPATVRMHDQYRALDHIELRARSETLTAASGTRLRGHEFHYSSAAVGTDATFAFDVERGDGIVDEKDGLHEYRTLGTYGHVHPESGAFDRFLQQC